MCYYFDANTSDFNFNGKLMIQPHILKLPTPRLLAYYKKHYQHTCNPHECRNYDEYTNTEKAAEWDTDRTAIKAELDIREHVEK